MPCRHMSITPCHRRPIVVYSDCSSDGMCGLRVGILIFHPTGTFSFSVDPPQDFIDTWLPRGNYINLGELVAGPICCSVFGPLLENEDVVWFVDNTSALSALIRRASSTEDLNTLALVFGLSMTALHARVWFEYIQSASNPSDVLSRKAWGDLDVQRRLASGEWTRVDAVVPWQAFSIAQVPDLFRAFQACLD